MNSLVKLTIILNIILLILTSVGSFYVLTKKPNPKTKANIATVIVCTLFTYCFLLLSLMAYGILHKNYCLSLLGIFVIIPFILGSYVKYKTLKKYTILQILALFISLLFLSINII